MSNNRGASDVGEVLYRRLKATQRELGLARFELGTLLEVFKGNEGLWSGRATSFPAFLEEERIQPDGAKKFMRVAKKFVLELGLNDQTLAELACVNFRILELAAKIITPENKDEVLAMVIALGERDARVALAELADPDAVGAPAAKVSAPVNSLMRRFRELPDDYRIEFMNQLRGNARSNARQTPNRQ